MRLERILNYILPFVCIGFLTLIINIYGINDLEDYSGVPESQVPVEMRFIAV